MTKVVYEYTSVKVPTDAKDMIDVIFEEEKKNNPRIRKADLWLSAVYLLLEDKQ